MATPHKPSDVDVKALQDVVAHLNRVQTEIQSPPPRSFDAIVGSLESDLKRGGGGLQGNAAQVAGERYTDATDWVSTKAWTQVKEGVTTVINLLEQTIAKHSAADTHVATGARKTNTTAQAAPAAGTG